MSWNSKIEKERACNKKNLAPLLHPYVKNEEQIDMLLEIIDQAPQQAEYKDFIRTEEDNLHNIRTELLSLETKRNDLIEHFEKYDDPDQADLLRSLVLHQPQCQKRMTPKLMQGLLKEVLKEAGFKNITKLVTDLNTIIGDRLSK